VKGSVLSFAVVPVGSVLVVAAAASFGVVDVPVSLAAEVPLLDFGVVPVLAGVVLVVVVVFAGVVGGVVVVLP
jgi:hypothetical protein